MKRYYLSPVIGTGDISDPFRAKVQDHGVSFVAVIPSDPNTGQPLHPFTLCIVDALNHSKILQDTTIEALPDFPLDARMSAMNSAAQQRLSQALTRFNIANVNNNQGYRELIRSIGQQLEPSFNENNFDISS